MFLGLACLAPNQLEAELFIVSTGTGERTITSDDLPAYERYSAALRAPSLAAREQLYEEALALKPSLPEANINLSNLLSERGEAGDLLRARTLLQVAQASADNDLLRATALSNLGHLEQRVAGRDLRAAALAEKHYRQGFVISSL